MTPVVAGEKLSRFDPKTFLSTMDGGRKIAAFPKKQTIFAQGDSEQAIAVSEPTERYGNAVRAVRVSEFPATEQLPRWDVINGNHILAI